MLIRHLALVLAVAANPAAAQTRTLVVPDGSGVAIPARGAVPGVSTMAARSGRPRSAANAVPLGPDRETLSWKQLWPLVPLGIAAAVVAATLPGGGGGGAGAPAATR